MVHAAATSIGDLYNFSTTYQPAYTLRNSSLYASPVLAIPNEPIALDPGHQPRLSETLPAETSAWNPLHHLNRLVAGAAELERVSRWYSEHQHRFPVRARRWPTRHELPRQRFYALRWRLEDEIVPAFRRLIWVVNRLLDSERRPDDPAQEETLVERLARNFEADTLDDYLDGWLGVWDFERYLIAQHILHVLCADESVGLVMKLVEELTRRIGGLSIVGAV